MGLSRALRPRLQAALERFPVVLVTGARKTGKTTLVTDLVGADADWARLEEPHELELARTDPDAFLDRHPGPVTVVDDVQLAPGLAAALANRLERHHHPPGRWVLIAPRHPEVLHGAREHLAGLVVVLELLPLGLSEGGGTSSTLADVVWWGLFPDPATGQVDRDQWMGSFVETFFRNTVRTMLEVRDHRLFTAFMAACASRHGQVLNIARLARDCRISEPTAKEWLRVLTAGSLVHLVPPFPHHFGRRQVKAPKMYLVDPGLVTYLTGQASPTAALSGPLGDALLEGLVVMEVVKLAAVAPGVPGIYHWRTYGGLAVDLLLACGSGLIPMEVTVAAAPAMPSCLALSQLAALAGERCAGPGVVVCRAERPTPLPRRHMALPWQLLPAWLADQLSR